MYLIELTHSFPWLNTEATFFKKVRRFHVTRLITFWRLYLLGLTHSFPRLKTEATFFKEKVKCLTFEQVQYLSMSDREFMATIVSKNIHGSFCSSILDSRFQNIKIENGPCLCWMQIIRGFCPHNFCYSQLGVYQVWGWGNRRLLGRDIRDKTLKNQNESMET